MKVSSIIAEYNPFHNGHLFHLEETRRITSSDYIIVVMSGNFMQRGTPALIDKFMRAEMALSCGADLVLELPSYYAVGSAEYFSMGAVTLLDKLNVVDTLCFGSESGNLDFLRQISELLIKEPDNYILVLKEKLKEGLSYPNARTHALIQTNPTLEKNISDLSSPNNILGIEYIKALLKRKSKMEPITIPRVSSQYHDKNLGTHTQSSATALRQTLYNQQPLESLKEHMPAESYHLLSKYFLHNQPLYVNDFSEAMIYKLIFEQKNGYSDFVDVTNDFSDRINNHLYSYTNLSDFCDLLKTKEQTHTRITRSLFHILLNMKSDVFMKYCSNDYIPYARVLGFRKDAAPLLSFIKKNSSIPMITKLANAAKILDFNSYEMLKEDLTISSYYYSILASKSHNTIKNEYTTPLIII